MRTTLSVCFVWLVVAAGPAWTGPCRVGLDFLTHFDELPYLCNGTSTWQVSSRDPAGDNADGLGCDRFLYADGEHVIFDAAGPGSIEDIWMTALPPGSIRIYFDNEPTPRVNLPVTQFFAGNTNPFRRPLVGDDNASSGGFYCKLSMPYARRARIAFTDPPCYWHVLYQTYPAGTPVTTFSTGLDVSGALALLNAPGTDPKPTAGNVTQTGSVTVPPGEGRTAFTYSGAGSIAVLKIDPSPAADAVLQNVWFSLFFDGAFQPHVAAPLGLFFGCGEGEENVRGLPIGMSKTGSYYCYFPMPFWQSVRLDFYNGQGLSVTLPFEIQYKTVPYDRDAGYFCARYKHEPGTTPGVDYLILDTHGSGHYVGASLYFSAAGTNLGFLEGDERIYVDGSATPQLNGTGTEDYLEGGWYFNRGPFSLPLHGLSRMRYYDGYTRCSMYRFHIGDRIPFMNRIVVGMEHGGTNMDGVDYASVAYYYWKPTLSAIPGDRFDVGSLTEESARQYANWGQTWAGALTDSYEGDWDQVTLTDTGRAFADGYSRFALALSPANAGLRLWRRHDHGHARQRGEVFLDGRALAPWETLSYNGIHRWHDTSIVAPAAWTAGKDRVTAKIQAGRWNEFRYTADSLVDAADYASWEAESLSPVGSSGDAYVTVARPYEANWSWGGSAIAEFRANADGDWVRLRVPVAESGWYAAWAVLARETTYGIARLEAGGAAEIERVDLYADAFRRGPLASPGTIVALEPGWCEFRLAVEGKNPASGGRTIGIDTLCLARLAVPTPTPTPVAPTRTPTPSLSPTPTVEPRTFVLNRGFEEGFGPGNVGNHWSAYRRSDFPSVYADRTDIRYSGAHSQGWTMPGAATPNRHAGVYQRIPVHDGHRYRVSAHVQTKYFGSEQNSYDHVMARLGVDPLGDTAAPSGWVEVTEYHSQHDVWHSASVTVTAGHNGFITVFLDGWRKFTDGSWTEGYVFFDEVTIEDLTPTTPTPTPTHSGAQALLSAY